MKSFKSCRSFKSYRSFKGFDNFLIVLFTLFWVAICSAQTTYYEVQFDVDNDGVYEIARDTNSNLNDGYEIYIDPNINSVVIKRLDFMGDGTWDFLIDIDLDDRPDVLWSPSYNVLYQLLRRNVDRDPQAEYEVLGTSYFYDAVDKCFYKFCRVMGTVTDEKKNPIPDAQVSIYYEGYTEPIVETNTDLFGNYNVEITTITLDKYHIIKVRKLGYLTEETKEWLVHDKIFSINFVLTATNLDVNDIKFYPNPVKKDGVINFCVNLARDEKVVIDLLDIRGRFIKRLFEDKLSKGQTEFNIKTDYPASFYFLYIELGNNYMLKTVKIEK